MSKKRLSLLLILLTFLVLSNFSVISGESMSRNDDFVVNQTKQTAISKADLMINTFLLLGSMNLTIEYIQIEENSTRFIDSIEIKGNVSDVSVVDSLENALLLGFSFNETTDTTLILFQLQRALNLGEKYSVSINCVIPTKELIQNRVLDFEINWTQTVSVFSAIVYLEKYLVLLSTTPPPQTTSVINQRIKMTWDTIMLDDFYLYIEFKASLAYEVISVSPTIWNVGNVSRHSKPIKQTYTIRNLLNTYVRVDVINNNSWINIVSSLILSPYEEEAITAELDISKIGSFQSLLLFSTNMSLQEIVCSVSVNVEKTTNPWTIAGLIVGVSLFALAGLAFYMFAQMKPVEEVIEEKKNQEQIKHLKIEKLEGFLNENELLIVKQVMDKPGISQAQIVRNTGISKATLSRIIGKMERKGMIIKKSVGMSHQLYIDKESSFFKYAKK